LLVAVVVEWVAAELEVTELQQARQVADQQLNQLWLF
jgi:hypothetical protein